MKITYTKEEVDFYLFDLHTKFRYVLSLFKDVYEAKGIHYERDDKDERTD